MPPKAHKTRRIVEKIPPSPKKSEEPETCAICFEEMEEGQDIKTLNCRHKFHRNCIDGWINTKIINHQVPSCPTCRAEIEPTLAPAPAPAPLFDPAPEPAPAPPRADPIDRDIAVVELQEIQNDRQSSMPFLGVIVLYRDGGNRLNHLKTYLNTDLGLTLNSTLMDLKNAIRGRPNELAVQCPLLSQPRAGVFLSNLVLPQRQASFVIEKMYFGTPAGLENDLIRNYPGNIHSDMPYGTDHQFEDYNYAENRATLQTVYRLYREKAKDILDEGRDSFYRTRINGRDVGFSPLKDVFNRYILSTRPQRMVVEYLDTNYFYNRSNPDIPPEFRPEPYYRGRYDESSETEEILKKSTKIPLAWMIVEVGCGTFRGGKTRRRNKSRRKRNKSQRNRSVR